MTHFQYQSVQLMFTMLFLLIFVHLFYIKQTDAHCIDIHNHIIPQGVNYVPGPTFCNLCICDKGTPKWCSKVMCSLPQNCKSFKTGDSCCEYECMDDYLSKVDNRVETNDLALRLIASAVVALLSLSFLLFLIHRLRQRKKRERQNRQMNEDQRSLNSIGYITGSIGYLPGSIGYLGSGNNELEFHYDESNVHFPLWKPPGNYFPREEAPPPYEEAVRLARIESEMAHNQLNTNTAPYTFSSNRNENVNVTLVHNTHVSITPSAPMSGVPASQCNVMLHQSNNVQSNEIPLEVQVHQPTSSASVTHDYVIDSSSTFLQNATVESLVDVHYENFNHANQNIAPVVTVSVKNEDSFPQQTLNVDFLRDRIDRGSYATADIKPTGVAEKRNESSGLSCSSSWRREAVQCSSNSIKPNFNSAQDLRIKPADKSKSCKAVESAPIVVDSKYKKCNVAKDVVRTSKPYIGRQNDNKQRSILKGHNTEPHKEISIHEATKHRTIPQKFLKSSGCQDPGICYVNSSEFVKRKHIEDDFSDHCNTLLKQHNIEKLRYVAEKLEKKNAEKATGNRNIQRGIMKGEISSHRTLPKNLQELNEVLYFNFDNSAVDGMNADCRNKKMLPKNTLNDIPLPLVKNSDVDCTRTLGRKHQDKKSNCTTVSNNNVFNIPHCKSQPDIIKHETNESDIELEDDKDKNSISYHYLSSAQDDVDDYRSECENCKSLSFEDCNNEEGDVLNETMTLQRRPTEQGEEHSFYLTSLTLPSHSKKNTRSVTLNTPRESWFMAMQEVTSSSESD